MKYFLGNQPETKKVETLKEVKEEIKTTTEETDFEHEKAMKVKRHFLYEDKSKREPNAKHYVGNDGTATAVYSAKAVHFSDGNEMKEIDNSLCDNGETLETKANAFKTRFKKRSSDGEIFEVTKGKCKVGLKSHDLAKHCDCGTDDCTCEETNAAASTLLFKNVSGNVDLQYIVDSDRVKENIIVKEKSDAYEYDFGMNIENLDAGISDDGKTLQLKDKESGEVKFYIPAPFMTDAAGERSELVGYEIAEQTADTLNLKVVADSEWINAEERAFPVTIDPQIVSADTSLFSYEYYEAKEMTGSGGTYTGWSKVNAGSEVFVDSTHKFNIKIDKSKFAMPLKNITSVKLNIFSDYRSTCCVNGTERSFLFGFYDEIDVTDLFKSTKECILNFTPAIGQKAIFLLNDEHAPYLVIEYMEDETGNETGNETENEMETRRGMRRETRSFSLAGGVTGAIDFATGAFTTAFSDIETGSSVLPLQISHVYLTNDNNFNCGNDWRLNLHQKLEKSGDEYVYTDGAGQKHIVNDIFYYIKDSKRQLIDKYQVNIEPSGLLTCTVDNQTYEVTSELRTNEGLRLVTRLDFTNSNYLEQRQDEEKQLEEYVDSYKKSLDDFYLVLKTDLSKMTKLDYSSSNTVNSFLYHASTKAILTYSEILQVRNYNINIALESTPDSLKKYYSDQEEYLWKQAESREETVKKLYTEYLSKSEQLKQLKRQLPTAYLIDDNGKILCFNRYGKLCAITDRYQNYIVVEWGDIVTSSGKQEAITAVYDGERKTTFKYNRAGRLISITDPDGNRISYTYNEDKLVKVKFSNGKILYFTYESDEITYVRSNYHILSKIQYDGYVPKAIINYSTIANVTGSTETVPESLISSTDLSDAKVITQTAIIYNKDYAKIEVDGKKAEYIIFDEFGNVSANYFKTGSSIDGLKLYKRKDRKFEFTVTPKKTENIISNYTGIDGIITSYLGTPTAIRDLPDMTNEYSDYGEADWELVTLDDFNRPVRSETNWHIAKTATGKTVYSKKVVTYTYAADKPDYNCLKKTTTVYTNFNGKQSTLDAESKVFVEEYSYCEHGNLVKTKSYVEGEEGTSGITVTERVCDEKGNIVKEFTYNSLDSSTKFYKESEVAENGKITAEIDETGENKTELIYNDGANTVKTQVLPNGSKFSCGYDESGNITAITQSTESGEENSTCIKYTLGVQTRLTSGNNVINYEYDYKRRKTAVILNGVTHAMYTYSESASEDTVTTVTANKDTFVKTSDKNGKVISVKYKNNVLVQYGYDSKDRLISREDKTTGETANFTYDSNNFLTEYSCGNTTETYEYNDHGELAIKVITGEVSQAYGYFYKNNAARDLDYISFGEYKFKPLSDVNGRNTGKEIHGKNGKTAGEYISYRKVGDHATNMPSAIWYANGKVIKDNIKYKYDSCGNICEIKENGALAVRYEYDALNRLVREDNKKLKKTYLFEYDGNGNIVSKRETAFTLRAEVEECDFETFEYSYEGDKLISYNGELCAYNEMGSPTTYRGKTAVWKYGKLLTEFDGKTFAYDGLGRRTGKCDISFTYDSNGNLIKQSNGIEFVYDNGGVIGFKYDKQYFYRKDVQGNIIAILDSTGNVVVEYSYDAWGNCDFNGDESLAELNPFRYRGYYYDKETKLYYLQTRYYDPETGRFISQDSVEYLNPEHINGLNLYAYCGNNPVMGYDPNGTWDWGKFFVGLGLILTAVAAIAVSILTFGAATPLAIMIVAGVTLAAGILTGINGIATIVEAGTEYNFVRDGIFQGNETAYNWYVGVTEVVAIVGTMICGNWLKVNSPRIKAYKNISKASFTNTLSDTTHMSRPFQQSTLLQQQIIKSGKMIKEGEGIYKFLAEGAYRIGFEGNVHSGITWKLVIDVANNVIMHIGPF